MLLALAAAAAAVGPARGATAPPLQSSACRGAGCGDVSLLQAQVEVHSAEGEASAASQQLRLDEGHAARAYHEAVSGYRRSLAELTAAADVLSSRKPPARKNLDGVLTELSDISSEMYYLRRRFEDLSVQLPELAKPHLATPQFSPSAARMVEGTSPVQMLPVGAISLMKNPWLHSGKDTVVNAGYASGLSWHQQHVARESTGTEEVEVRRAAVVNPWIILILVVLSVMVIGAIALIASPFSIQEQGKKPEQGSRYNFLQVVLPYWVPTTPNSRGCLFVILFLTLLCLAASLTFWTTLIALKVGNSLSPGFVKRGPDYGIYSSHVLRIVAALVVFVAPVVFFMRRRDLRGRWEQWTYLGLRLFVMLMLNTWAVATSYISARQMDAMVALDRSTWWSCTTLLVAGIVYTVIGHMANYYLQHYIGMKWRAFLTHHFLDLYMARRTYYAIDPSIMDNPDQRIQEDASKVTTGLLEFVLSLISSFIGIISFAAVLWSLMPALTISGVIYAVVGSLIALGITWRLVKLNYVLQRSEADFRFSLVHVRNNAEAIAFYRGEAREKEITKSRFSSVLAVTYRNVCVMSLNRGFTEFYYVFANVIPAFILCGPYFRGQFDVGQFGQAGSAFATTVASLSFVVDQIEVISDLATATNRLGALLMLLKRPEEPPGIKSVSLAEPRIELRDLTATTPGGGATGGGRVLIRSLSLAVGESGGGPARLLVVGNSGVGKSSLLRVLAGLWQNGSGEVGRPPNADCVFMPQKPYMPLGNLRTQLLYPDLDSNKDAASRQPIDDSELRVLLERVGLGNLADRFEDGFEATCDWARVLSLGEQQRLASVRCFLQSPKLTVLDEATSALSDVDERRLYEHFWNLKLSYVSVAHRDSLINYHDMVLELRGGAEWRLYKAEEYRVALARRRG